MKGNRCIGVVREAYSKWERRTPLTPAHVSELVRKGIDVVVQPSFKRVYMDQEYVRAGATVSEDLTPCSVILGVKQVAEAELLPEKTYMFFSHVIKGQPENMPLLDTILKKNIRLIDYECVTQGGGRGGGPRLIAFGQFAGNAGMVNILRGVGERMLALGYSNPFLGVPSSYMHHDLNAARFSVREAGNAVAPKGWIDGGIPKDFAPFVVTFTGNGNVSKGAQDIFSLLPHTMVRPEDLPHLPKDTRQVFGCVVEEEHMVATDDDARKGSLFSRKHYYSSPELYRSVFAENIAPHTSVLVNCAYWDRRYPQTLTGDQLRDIRVERKNEKLLAIADLSCDIDGGIGFLSRSTTVEQPFYMYNPSADAVTKEDGVDGSDGVVMMGVDILPSELPREASTFFGDALMPFLEQLASSDGTKPFSDQNDLPPELRGAIIACNGRLAPDYAYIAKLREEMKRESSAWDEDGGTDDPGSTVILLQGHLFDSGLINQALDVIEQADGVFHVDHIEVRPNLPDSIARSSAAVQVSLEGGRPAIDELLRKLTMLADLTPNANGSVAELPRTYCSGNFSTTTNQLITKQNEKDPPRIGVRGPRSSSFAEPSALVNPVTKESGVRRIAVLGAGLVARPLVEYLSRDARHAVTVVSALESEVKPLEDMRPNVYGRVLDVGGSDAPVVDEMIANSDVVVSILPAFMHVPIARSCVNHGTPLVTASYVSDEMAALHDEAVRADVPILCEMGLDPGMDHMSAMAVIDAVKDEGGRIVEFSSLCGGLPAPEVAALNPLQYKFSWSPAGVMSAAQNSAKYRREGLEVTVPGENLLASARPAGVFETLRLEELPNRDSLPYGKVYGISDAETIYRGTLRFEGWSGAMRGFMRRGWFDASDASADEVSSAWAKLCEDLRDGDAVPEGEDPDDTAKIRACADFLGGANALASSSSFASNGSLLQSFSGLLAEKLTYDREERDMCLMHHSFGVELADGTRETRTSSLIAFGSPSTDTAMAKTVGITAAIGARLLLSGDVRERGVMVPTKPSVYIPGLRMLQEEGIEFHETVSRV
eukprot:g3035.t1